MTPEQLEQIREAYRKLSLSLEADLPSEDDIYEMEPKEFDEKYSKDIVFARLKA